MLSNKVVRIGDRTFANIKFSNGKLSITGVINPTRGGNADSCGQIDTSPWEIKEYAPGWSPELEARFREVWHEWHLNDMKAGSPAQRAWLKAHPELKTYEDHRDGLRAAGLNPDPNWLIEGKPYGYGMRWLREEVPADVLEFLASLPDTDITPNWI